MDNENFEIYLTHENYIVSWEGKLYLFPMEDGEIEQDFGSMLAYTFLAPDAAKPDELIKQRNNFEPMKHHLDEIKEVLGANEPWISINPEQIEEMNNKAAEVAGITLH